MINGKKIYLAAVDTGSEIIMCRAPYGAYLWPSDHVEVEGMDGFGTILIIDCTDMDSKEYETVDMLVGTRRIMRKIEFSNMNWSGYEEEEDEQNDISGQTD